MGRLLKTSDKKKNGNSCIFCGYEYQKKKRFMSAERDIDYHCIPPLGTEFYPVCIHCKSILEHFIAKYPHLWE